MHAPGVFLRFSLFVLFLVGCRLWGQEQTKPVRVPDRRPQFVPNQLLVRFQPTVSKSSASAARARAASTLLQSYSVVPGLQLVNLQPGMSVDQALQIYRSDPSVLYAEPNYIRQPLDNTPNDPYFHDLWGLHNIGQTISFPYPTPDLQIGLSGADIHALEAWAITTGSSDVVVGIIDTGVDYNHEDLAANMYRNEADCNSNGVDDDGNGYIDDCYGINTLDNNSDPMDVYDHGTHVAGTIGAVGNNGIGVTGVNWSVKIIACKFIGFYGGTDDGAIACLDYMAKMKDAGVNIVATNNSWGGYGYSQALYDAIDVQRQKGILFIAAAGNADDDNDGAYPLYPAGYSLANLIAVAATTYRDELAYFSSFGAHSVHLGAPGYRVMSTTPSSTYSIYSGTSMATPHVTGVAALLKAQDATRDWKTIRNLILTGGDKLAALNRTVTQSRLNAYGSLTCSGKTLSAPLLPRVPRTLTSVGQPLALSQFSLNCGSPAGAPQVAVAPDGQQVTLLDDGIAPDTDANDGIYSGQWTPTASGVYTLTFPGGQSVMVGADPYTYTSTTFQYRRFAGTSLKLTDNSFAWIDSPFTISFGGGAYDGFYVSDNGSLTFDSPAPPQSQALPYRYANTLIAPFWDDLVPAAGGNVFWTVNGAVPNRELVVEWRNMSHAGCATDGSESVTFQAVLFENSTEILFNYLKTAFGGSCAPNDGGAMASVGVQVNSTTAKQYLFRIAGLTDNTAVDWKTALPTNPVPVISSVNPKSWVADIMDMYVLVQGTSFGSNAVFLVNGAPRPTYSFGETLLFGAIRASDLATPGNLQLSVFNGLPEGGPSAAVAFPVNAPDFRIYLNSQALTVRVGQAVTTTVYAYPNPAFHDGIALSCSGLPANAACDFDPSRILADGYSILTIRAKTSSVAAVQMAPLPTNGRNLFWLPVVGIALLGCVRLSGRKGASLLAVMVVAICTLSCGSSSHQNQFSVKTPTPIIAPLTSGTYTVMITGTSGSTQHSVTLTVTVTS